LAVVGTEAKQETAAAGDVHDGGVLGDPQRVGDRQRHHRAPILMLFIRAARQLA
jgi:hypothetical protein